MYAAPESIWTVTVMAPRSVDLPAPLLRADAYQRLQSLPVEEDAAEEWDGNEDIWRKEEEDIEGLKRQMEEMEQLRLEQDEKDEEDKDNEENFMEDNCQTVSEVEEEKKEESAYESESESSQSTLSEMDQISMCEPPSPAVSHVER
uniref:Uncharacterized protein n=1 Tax=Proboscia inermis TaxID=420281 RepID=A0A7S0C6P3_9STRA|mmetsp:Transcript_27439/g.27842  ORF Transcript_27439/g.27842 Transcript_27439/m.27842 type:complete len:146 (+) Transcript_27439:169-606(+)|eukprot:CAMPEP_0171314090 /NCGR_PEP_ID=MMETSP0816-20121228/48702_1 /TAXON_ID=420281 /ORGANISM="Proboscia inermis, Strain CCAP1064/1" /LENGTH=145 /DNA_ID=CAMNT_0011802519 /DNA_START=178 /DNA_END=615 /DNA_ORIENTATION=+